MSSKSIASPNVRKVTHTPGPWYWQGDSLTHRQFDIYAPNNSPQQHVCTVNNLSVDKLWHRDAAQAEANALLIASAPDLLRALEKVIEAVRQGPAPVIGFDHNGQRQKDFNFGWNSAKDQVWNALDEARAAIAKATGA